MSNFLTIAVSILLTSSYGQCASQEVKLVQFSFNEISTEHYKSAQQTVAPTSLAFPLYLPRSHANLQVHPLESYVSHVSRIFPRTSLPRINSKNRSYFLVFQKFLDALDNRLSKHSLKAFPIPTKRSTDINSVESLSNHGLLGTAGRNVIQ